jgi:hypothetical protein
VYSVSRKKACINYYIRPEGAEEELRIIFWALEGPERGEEELRIIFWALEGPERGEEESRIIFWALEEIILI